MQTALIVDDSTLARLTLKRFLLKHNINVFEAECVADCRYWLRHNQQPDVIFMDITMPEVDGFEALAEIRSDPETKHLPVIMYSGDVSEEAKQKAREGKATGFLRKPVNEQQLTMMLDKLNERYQQLRSVSVEPRTTVEHIEPVVESVPVRQTPQSVTPTAMATRGPEPAEVNVLVDTLDTHQAPESAPTDVRELRQDIGKINVAFERQQESISSLKTMLQRQSNDLLHLQNSIQQNEKSMKKLAIAVIGATLLALVGIVLIIAK